MILGSVSAVKVYYIMNVTRSSSSQHLATLKWPDLTNAFCNQAASRDGSVRAAYSVPAGNSAERINIILLNGQDQGSFWQGTAGNFVQSLPDRNNCYTGLDQ